MHANTCDWLKLRMGMIDGIVIEVRRTISFEIDMICLFFVILTTVISSDIQSLKNEITNCTIEIHSQSNSMFLLCTMMSSGFDYVVGGGKRDICSLSFSLFSKKNEQKHHSKSICCNFARIIEIFLNNSFDECK